jgi:hypothetical protein
VAGSGLLAQCSYSAKRAVWARRTRPEGAAAGDRTSRMPVRHECDRVVAANGRERTNVLSPEAGTPAGQTRRAGLMLPSEHRQ